MFEMRGTLDSVKDKVFRIVGSPEKEDCNVSSCTPTFTAALHGPTNSLTNYSLEAELRKAQALAYWRLWENRPK